MSSNFAKSPEWQSVKRNAAAIAGTPYNELEEDKTIKVHANPTLNPLHEIALTSFLLGLTVSGTVFLAIWFPSFAFLSIYITSLAVFHFMEYYVTAKYNTLKVTNQSFLFHNGAQYYYAQSAAVVEFLLWFVVKRYTKLVPHILVAAQCYLFCLGLSLVILGQFLRSMAMIHASSNFSHKLADHKIASHELVTTGVYAYMRHPSYAGFFIWSLGTQVMLNNPISLVVFSVVLSRFFADRIDSEEKKLVIFFQDDYVKYKAKVGSGIPFVE